MTARSTARGDRPAPRTLLGVLARSAWFLEDEVSAIAELVPPGGVCVDVGAGYGLYTAAMITAVGTGGTVHAIEPQPSSRRVLDAVVRLYRADDRVVRHACAIGSAPGRSELSVPVRRGRAVSGRAFVTRHATGAGPNAADFAGERRYPVEVSTLDDLAALHGLTRLDMIKADVEGGELHVLTGGARTIARHRPIVQLEIEERHLDKYGISVAQVTGFLLDQGYTMHGWTRRGWRPAARVTDERRNYLFTP
ncbi:FkbM family methyltransferase [Demequina lignilytica]|uniref:FkbM family methyltransferase n=1 Tax=Demequina lignilytica TaxID=3051663 RepID=A0AAW7M1X1_9MICO|nr:MULTISPECIES: FkbM family methyltransferase [unclassified Demequina]MDN4482191.1 FkbM family methyltransferase [Demequina sp. SYSU T0a273]MDN4486850.1 FkbM family methyltransferase [Demequina sp. SYSU T00039]